MRIVGTAFDGPEAVAMAKVLRPDLILMDINLPTFSGIEATRKITRLLPRAKVIFVSQEDAPATVKSAPASGGRGYILKSNARKDLPAAMEAVVRGERYIGRGLPGFDPTETETT